MKPKALNTSADFVEFVAKLFDEVPPNGIAEAEEELRAAGLDPGEVGARLAAVAHEALQRSAARARERAATERKAALQQFESLKRPQRTRAQLEATLNTLMVQHQGKPAAARAAFHKLEGKASDQDLAELIAQLEYLENCDDTDGC